MSSTVNRNVKRLKAGALCGRMEPLILEGAELRRPVFAAYAKGGRRLHVGMQEMGEDPSHWTAV